MDGYSIFLMIELAKINGIINKNLAYDLMWNKGSELYNEFQNSAFDNPEISEYECIHTFLLYKKRQKLLDAISNLEDRGITAVEKYGVVYAVIDDIELELSDHEINYNAKEWLEKKNAENLED